MKHILLIEDNLEMRENTEEILELANYNVTTAENGKIGVALAQEILPDLIICDVMMPELDGYGVLYLLSKQAKTAGIPFIFLTAKAEKGDFRKGMELGADDYLTKPYDDTELLNAVESRLNRNELLKSSMGGGNVVEDFYKEAQNIDTFIQLSDNVNTKRYTKKDMLYLEGGVPRHFFYLKKGKIKLYKSNEDGKELTVDLMKEGDFFGYMELFEGGDYQNNAMVMEDAEVCTLPKEDFFKLLGANRDVLFKFIQLLSKEAIQKQDELLSLAYNTVRKRVADGLLKMVKAYDVAEVPVPRDELAHVVGTSTESVIRTLSEFKQDGLIEISGRKIKVINLEKLSAVRF